jgi:ADP-heptose:LPS heptosyltransferase
MIHLSDAANTPILGLFSGDNKNFDRYKPFWTTHKIIQSDSLSIENIDPEAVFLEYKKLVVN